MDFKKHSDLEGKHAILSASKYHWLNYSDDRMFEYIDNLSAARRGTELHEYASMAIKLGRKQPNTSQTVNQYINDCIGFFMRPEQILYYSPWAFGTADAISFRNRVLRIADLKTGTSKASGVQLEVYAALFCLEYKVRPGDIEFDLRIYQNDEITFVDTDAESILRIMDRIVELSDLITKRFEEEG